MPVGASVVGASAIGSPLAWGRRHLSTYLPVSHQEGMPPRTIYVGVPPPRRAVDGVVPTWTPATRPTLAGQGLPVSDTLRWMCSGDLSSLGICPPPLRPRSPTPTPSPYLSLTTTYTRNRTSLLLRDPYPTPPPACRDSHTTYGPSTRESYQYRQSKDSARKVVSLWVVRRTILTRCGACPPRPANSTDEVGTGVCRRQEASEDGRSPGSRWSTRTWTTDSGTPEDGRDRLGVRPTKSATDNKHGTSPL